MRSTIAALVLAVACLPAVPAMGAIEAHAEATFELATFRALPSAWVPELQASIRGEALVSRSGAEKPSGLLVRVVFVYPGGTRGGVLTLDLAHAAAGAIYGLDDATLVGWSYYEVGPDGVDLVGDTLDGSAEIAVLDEGSAQPVVTVGFDARVESHGPDGVAGTDDDQARELTRGTVATVTTSGGSGGGATTGASSNGSDGAGVVVSPADPWEHEAPFGPPIAFGVNAYDDSEGCGSSSSESQESGCSSDESSEDGGCSDSDSSGSDEAPSGCGGDDAASDSACESDATAATTHGSPARSWWHRRIVGALPFSLLLCAIIALRRWAHLP